MPDSMMRMNQSARRRAASPVSTQSCDCDRIFGPTPPTRLRTQGLDALVLGFPRRHRAPSARPLRLYRLALLQSSVVVGPFDAQRCVISDDLRRGYPRPQPSEVGSHQNCRWPTLTSDLRLTSGRGHLPCTDERPIQSDLAILVSFCLAACLPSTETLKRGRMAESYLQARCTNPWS